LTTLTLQLPDLSCGHCARAVTEAVTALDAQAQVLVDLAGKQVEISAAAAREAIVAALTEAGYAPAP
jgi:copper chaperone